MRREEWLREKNEACAQRHELAVDRLRSLISEETVASRYRAFF